MEDQCSDWCSITAGLSQGGVLSSLLFFLDINSINSTLLSPHQLCTNDLQIYDQTFFDDLPTVISSSLNAGLAAVSRWARQYGLILKTTITKALLTGNPNFISKIRLVYLKLTVLKLLISHTLNVLKILV